MKYLIVCFLSFSSVKALARDLIITECNDSVTYRVVEYLNNKNSDNRFQVSRNEKNEINGICDLQNNKTCFVFAKTFSNTNYTQVNIYNGIESSIISEYEVPTCKIKSIKESGLNSF